MKLLMTIFAILTFLFPLQYGIQSLIRLSRQRRTLYPLLRIKHPEGIRPLTTMVATGGRKPAPSFYS